MVRTFEITAIRMERLFCNKCENVEMIPHAPSISLAPGAPKRYTHKCPKCGYKETTDKPYPLQMLQQIEITPEMEAVIKSNTVQEEKQRNDCSEVLDA
jgi:DNA-directed RNA polymerase subunit M/transcription elongation factor TFIIS